MNSPSSNCCARRDTERAFLIQEIMTIEFWRTAADAKAHGCTHHARMFGIVPGFWGDQQNMWVSQSDLLSPIEDALAFLWVLTCQMMGREPDFMLAVGQEIA